MHGQFHKNGATIALVIWPLEGPRHSCVNLDMQASRPSQLSMLVMICLHVFALQKSYNMFTLQ